MSYIATSHIAPDTFCITIARVNTYGTPSSSSTGLPPPIDGEHWVPVDLPDASSAFRRQFLDDGKDWKAYADELVNFGASHIEKSRVVLLSEWNCAPKYPELQPVLPKRKERLEWGR